MLCCVSPHSNLPFLRGDLIYPPLLPQERLWNLPAKTSPVCLMGIVPLADGEVKQPGIRCGNIRWYIQGTLNSRAVQNVQRHLHFSTCNQKHFISFQMSKIIITLKTPRMTEPRTGLIQVLKQGGVKLDNAVLTTSSFGTGMRKILFTRRIVQFQGFKVFVSQGAGMGNMYYERSVCLISGIGSDVLKVFKVTKQTCGKVVMQSDTYLQTSLPILNMLSLSPTSPLSLSLYFCMCMHFYVYSNLYLFFNFTIM